LCAPITAALAAGAAYATIPDAIGIKPSCTVPACHAEVAQRPAR
jgi:hypothetical protein